MAQAVGQAAARLRSTFGWAGPAPAGSVRALILLSGLPGTGKSHLAAAIATRHPAAVVRSDEVRKTLYPQPKYTGVENGFVYLTCYALLERLLADGYTVIFDATNLLRGTRLRARKIASQSGAPVLTLVTVASPEVVAERLGRRAAGTTEAYFSDADWTVHQKLAATVQALNAAREPYATVDTSRDSAPMLRLVDDFLAQSSAGTLAAGEQTTW